MKLQEPLVSIVVTVSDWEQELGATLDSIRAQTIGDFCCIVVEDQARASETYDLPDRVRKDTRFRFLSHRVPSDTNAARDTGLRAVATEYVCFIESGKTLHPDTVEARFAALIKTHAPLVAGVFDGPSSANAQILSTSAQRHLHVHDVIDIFSAQACSTLRTNQLLLRTQALKSIGGFEADAAIRDDAATWLRFLRHGYVFLSSTSYIETQRTGHQLIRQVTPQSERDDVPRPRSVESIALCIECTRDRALLCLNEPLETYKKQLTIYHTVLRSIIDDFVDLQPSNVVATKVAHQIPDLCGALLYRYDPREEFQNCLRDTDAAEADDVKTITRIEDSIKTLLDGFPSKTSFHNGNRICQPNIDILFLPHNSYHMWTISLCLDALKRRDLRCGVVDLSIHFGNEGVRGKAKELGISLIPFSKMVFGKYRPKVLVSFNDWEAIARSVLIAGDECGIETACIVEGIQDYDDCDTGRRRHAYKTAAHILLPGEFDRRYFGGSTQSTEVVGVPRIAYLRKQEFPRSSNSPTVALINSNFSYGVLEDVRDTWLTDAVEACRKCGIEPVISRHRADAGTLFPDLVATADFYEALAASDIVIQRFSSGILEALAMKRPVLYYNPHNERVDKFKDTGGAFISAKTFDDLVAALASEHTYQFDIASADRFLDHHCGALQLDPSEAISDYLAALVAANSRSTNKRFCQFSAYLTAIDAYSACCSDLWILKKLFLARYGNESIFRRFAHNVVSRAFKEKARSVTRDHVVFQSSIDASTQFLRAKMKLSYDSGSVSSLSKTCALRSHQWRDYLAIQIIKLLG